MRTTTAANVGVMAMNSFIPERRLGAVKWISVPDFESVINLILLTFAYGHKLMQNDHTYSLNEYFIDYKCPCGSCMAVLGNSKWTK